MGENGKYTVNEIRLLVREDPDYRILRKEQFVSTVFTKENPLNQLLFDEMIGWYGTYEKTSSCQTSALINSYAYNLTEGITGQEILNVFCGENNNLIYYDGSPKSSLNDISVAIAKEKKLDKYIHVGNKKNSTNVWGNAGVITGLVEKGKNIDSHFVFQVQDLILDSLPADRPAAKKYIEHSHIPLYWRKLEK